MGFKRYPKRGVRMKCEICGKEILRDSQCINYKYYHNDCIENLLQENKKQKEVIDKLELENKVLKEQMVAMVKPNYTYGIR